MTQPSILIVDDEPDNFDVIETILMGQDYELHYAANGKDAIASLEFCSPDVILLDVMMPELDGIEVCRRIKASPQWQAIPIIMVTALNTKDDLARCLQVGADDFISKPVSAVEMRARVQSMLRIKQQYDSIKTLSDLQKDTIDLLQSTLDEMRGGLASSLPHELNTPLTGILGTLGLLIDSFDEMDSGEVRELLDLANRSAHRLERLTKRFLIYLELELASKKLTSKVSGLASCTQAVIEPILQMKARQEKRSDDLVVGLEDAVVSISERYLWLMLNELLDNALKFSQPGTPVSITSTVEGNRVHLAIADQGQGMTEEQIAKIGAFMQFERKTYEQQGIGIGLRIVKKIVEMAGGELSIASVYRQETVVHVMLPRRENFNGRE
ncbi:MAG TPA: hybrid sensor histidine kinase/response regulator [Chroococcidiopsis sp.]